MLTPSSSDESLKIFLPSLHGKVARFICDVVKPDGTPFEGDSRYILKRAISQAKEMGFELDVAIKSEFFLFDLDENGEPTNHTTEKGGYFDIGPTDGGENTRRDMVLYLADMGIEVESSYHSDEAAQHVLDLSHVDALSMATVLTTRRVVIISSAIESASTWLRSSTCWAASSE